MKLEDVKFEKKVNGHGVEIIQVYSTVTGKRLMTVKTSFTDSEIKEDVNFEIEADFETRTKIAEAIISLKNEQNVCTSESTEKAIEEQQPVNSLVKTTVLNFPSVAMFSSCGDYAGEFEFEAFAILNRHEKLHTPENEEWLDIMHDQNKNVYAVFADGPLTSFSTSITYVQLDRDDCEKAFKSIESKF